MPYRGRPFTAGQVLSVPHHLPQSNTPSQSLAALAHTKLAVLHTRVSQRDTEMEITVRYGYVANIGSLVCALTKWESDREGAFDWGEDDGGHMTGGK